MVTGVARATEAGEVVNIILFDIIVVAFMPITDIHLTQVGDAASRTSKTDSRMSPAEI